jgi:hypothetical protein
MRSSMLSLFVAVAFIWVGCSGPPDHYADAGPDSAYPSVAPPPPCTPEILNTSVHHCGECDNRCPGDISDRCEDGMCMCGNSLACPEDYECRLGVCLAPDPEGSNCEFDDACPSGYLCIRAHCTRVSCEPEQCDGSDNDCDGFVDENAGSSGPLTEWCGPLDAPPPCRRGHRVCTDGAWEACVGAITPVPEFGLFACDEIDNDCDGCVDGTLTEEGVCERRRSRNFDVLYIIDTSGSMSSHIAQVRNATRLFSSTFAARSEFRFGIVTTGPRVTPPESSVVTDFEDFVTFETVLSGVSHDSSGAEPTYDAVADACDGRLGLSWREEAVRIIIVFTDEEGQSYRDPLISESDMCSSCSEGQVLGFFAAPRYTPDFDECGSAFNLYEDDASFIANLESLISDPCSP